MSSTGTVDDKTSDDDQVVGVTGVMDRVDLKVSSANDDDNSDNNNSDNDNEKQRHDSNKPVSCEDNLEPTASNNQTDNNVDNDDDDASVSSSSSSNTSTTDDSVTAFGYTSTTGTRTSTVGDDVLTTEQANEKLVCATQQKEQGNTHFQEGGLAQAARSYRRGVSLLKPLCKSKTTSSSAHHSNDPQIKALWIALQTNLSTVLFKQGKYKHSVQCATKALLSMDEGGGAGDGENETSSTSRRVKVFYRRAVAQRKLGNMDQAKADLKQALQYDKTNTTCKKELVSIQKELEQCKAAQKKALAKAFSNKSGSFLYDDKEAAEQRRIQKERQAEIQAQELYKQRKQQWEDECVSRMANNEPAISFEEWEKELKEKEEVKRKEEETRRKEEAKKRKEEERKHRELAKQQRRNANNDGGDNSDSDDDEELTKEEIAMMRGYKMTSDGRTTSYFTRELSEQEKQKIGDIAPKRLDSNSENVPTTLSSSSSGNIPHRVKLSTTKEGRSAWNAAGTWEERNTTAWCSAQLQRRLEETSVTVDKVNADIASIEELTGDASVAIAGGKKRYIFDFHVRLNYEINDPDKNNEVIAKGTVRLPDICSTSHEELEVAFQTAWLQKPPRDMEEEALAARTSLASELRKSVQMWVQDFNNQY